MTHLHAACRRLPDVPNVDRIPSKQLTIDLLDGSIRMRARGVRLLVEALKNESFTAYARLPEDPGCECRFYGPVRHVKQWKVFPSYVGPSRFVHRLDVGIIE